MGKHELGRPRKHESAAARTQAYRQNHGLTKVTIDVPTPMAQDIVLYAKFLRQSGRINRNLGFSEWGERDEDSGQFFSNGRPMRRRVYRYAISLTSNDVISSTIYEPARHFQGVAPEPYYGLRWEVSVNRRRLATGDINGLEFAKYICEKITESATAGLIENATLFRQQLIPPP